MRRLGKGSSAIMPLSSLYSYTVLLQRIVFPRKAQIGKAGFRESWQCGIAGSAGVSARRGPPSRNGNTLNQNLIVPSRRQL